ncbi:MAG: class 1 fructose-bisphosphatase [Dehalococcoidia bacterium]
MSKTLPTLETFAPEHSGSALGSVIAAIGDASVTIASQVRLAGLAEVLGVTGDVNVQGEEVQKLDILSNDAIISALDKTPACAGYASEELEQPVYFDHAGAEYVVVCDPLDGSSNIDVDVSIGTIFAVLRASDPVEDSFSQAGRRIAAAGYVVYGPSTVLIFSTGDGAHGFTLNPESGRFHLSHEDIRVPSQGKTYSINEGNSGTWDDGVKSWAAHVKESDKASGRPYSLRYVGSLVADAHRTLLKGGIFAYPADTKSPEGKLRLVYEANPMAYVFEAAGGAAINGAKSILDIQPEKLHQRTPLVIGSAEDVETFRAFATGERS